MKIVLDMNLSPWWVDAIRELGHEACHRSEVGSVTAPDHEIMTWAHKNDRLNVQTKQVDLHVHTNASDGDHRPRDVVRMAAERGLAAIAITDHDTIDGVAEAAHEGARVGVLLQPSQRQQ